MSSLDSERGRPDSYDDDDTQIRRRPGLTELCRPGYLLKWFWGFLEGWFVSRSYRQLAIGLPFLLIACGGPMFVWWLKSAPRDDLVAAYEVAVEESIKNNEPDKTGIYLESLVGLRQHRKEYRHQLVMHYVDQEQSERALQFLPRLTGADGYVPTQIWLLQQATKSEPIFPLSDEDTDRQLNAVLKKQPMNLVANWRMAERLIQKKQFKTAEDYLRNIVDKQPGLRLPLARVQIALQRDRKQVLGHLEIADQFYQNALLADNSNSQHRIQRADVMVLRDDLTGAMELIAEGRRLKDSEDLKIAESRLLVIAAKQKLGQSNLNAVAAAQDLVQAIRLNPQDSSLLAMAVSLSRLGVKWNVAQLQPAVDVLVAQPELTDSERQLLLASLSLTGQNQLALEVVERASELTIEDRILQAKLLLANGKQAAADALMLQLLAETEAKDDVAICLHRVSVLLLMNRYQEAYDLIEESQTRFADDTLQQVPEWQASFTQANLGLFESRLQNDEFKTAEEAIQMLTDSRQGPVAVIALVQRMLATAKARSDFEPTIRTTLVQLARRHRGGAQIYNILGTSDLQKSERDPKQLTSALKFLELAYQSDKANPMIMNNLAIALVRSQKDLQRARKLTEEAISKLSNPIDALSTRAEISVAEGRWEDARTDLEIALAERPNSVNVRRLLVQVLTAQGQPNLAEEHQAVYDQLTAAKAGASDPEKE